MRFRLIIDKDKPEEVTVCAHERSLLVEQIEALVLKQENTERITGYTEKGIKLLPIGDIQCITVLDGKTYAIDAENQQYRLKQRLYELEGALPSYFIRINKSTLANENALDRFAVTIAGSVDAIFQCGYREYVSRRCFSEIKRRLESR